ncbi:MAG: DUF707 domain-containing protein [Methanobacteriota archaeon]
MNVKEKRLVGAVQRGVSLPTYLLNLKFQTSVYNWQNRKKSPGIFQKSLYVSSVGIGGKKFLSKIVKKFGHENFDYLIFVYDDTEFNEKSYKKCSFIRKKSDKCILYQLAKKYLTPKFCNKYDFIFLWNDDIDVEDFSLKNFIDVMERNNLDMAQPALSNKSYYGHEITLRDERYPVGRYTDFVETMVPVFTRSAWLKFRDMIQEDYNFWGWGYDILAKSFCKYKNMGIVDCETVIHTRPIQSSQTNAKEDMTLFFNAHKKYKRSYRLVYSSLK